MMYCLKPRTGLMRRGLAESFTVAKVDEASVVFAGAEGLFEFNLRVKTSGSSLPTGCSGPDWHIPALRAKRLWSATLGS